MHIKQYVQDLDLEDGSRHRGKCPSCGKVNTFTATNNMGQLLWNCYSNSCGLSGKCSLHLTVEEIKKLMSQQNIRITPNQEYNPHNLNIEKTTSFRMPDHVVKSKDQEALIYKFCEPFDIDPENLGLLYDIKEDRIVFPMHNGTVLVDAIGRSVDSSILPKWKRYGDYSEGFVRGNCTIAVVVEDCISASVIETLDLTGIAILGTNLTPGQMETLRGYTKVIVALDPDAAANTIEYTKVLKGNGIDAFALKLLDDIKYRKQEDIQYLLKLKRDFHGTSTIKEPTK